MSGNVHVDDVLVLATWICVDEQVPGMMIYDRYLVLVLVFVCIKASVERGTSILLFTVYKYAYVFRVRYSSTSALNAQ